MAIAITLCGFNDLGRSMIVNAAVNVNVVVNVVVNVTVAILTTVSVLPPLPERS